MSPVASLLPMSTPASFLDATSLLDRFGGSFIWLSAVLLVVECGLLFPFLPGDSLLFAVGLFVASGRVDVLGSSLPGVELVAALAVLGVAALAGNLVGYEIGRALGPRVYAHTGRFVSRALLDRARTFLELRGGPTLVVARFVPFVRTYVTLVAGITRLDRRRFVTASAVGALLWTATITLLGFFLGSVPWVGDNIDVAITGIALFTVAPVALEAARRSWRRRRTTAAAAPEAATVPHAWRMCG